MADKDNKSDSGGGNEHIGVSPQKRKSEGGSDALGPPKKPFSMSIISKPLTGNSLKIGAGNKPSPVKTSTALEVRKPGIVMNIGKKPTFAAAPIKMAISGQPKDTGVAVKPKSAKVASVFNEDSESDEEEMPLEAKMRMKNIGRETPTAAGPNSFGKGNMGFCDRNKIIERDLKKQMEAIGDQVDKT